MATRKPPKKKVTKTAQKSEKTFMVNGYKINYSNFWGNYGVSHDEIGANIAQFKFRKDAVDYCKRG